MSETPLCPAINRKGLPCGNTAGFKTDHPGEGACHYHGGSSPGAPLGNKNALKTGEYEQLYFSALSDGERALWGIAELNAKAQAEHNLRLICVRIHRIMLRLNFAQLMGDDDGLSITKATTHQGWMGKQGKVNYGVYEREATLNTVMALEESLTRLQSVKIRAIEQLRSTLKDSGGGEDRLKNLVAAIDRSAALFAAENPPADAA